MTETGSSSSYDAETAGETNGDAGRTATTREWMGQLQSMIDNVATHAGPVMRDIAAKAAELAAAAGEKAGPIAHKAAEVTESAGAKLAERGREVAAELRRGETASGGGAGEGDVPNAPEPGPEGTTTYPSTSAADATPSGESPRSRADTLGE